MTDAHANGAVSLVVTGPSPATSGTTLTIASGTGQNFPAVPFQACVAPNGTVPSIVNMEIVRVLAMSGDTVTSMLRAQEGTAAQPIGYGWVFQNVPTRKTFLDLETPVKIGSLTVLGHSYIAGATQVDTGVSNPFQDSLISRLQALLGITQENVLFLGQAGSYMVKPTNSLGVAFGGWAAAFQFIVPSNSAIINAQNDVVISDPVVAAPGACVIVHGVNDIVLGYAFSTDDAMRAVLNIAAAKQAYRAVISRMQSGAVFGFTINTNFAVVQDASIVFSGGVTTAMSTAAPANTGPGYQKFSANGNSVTITLPTNFTGGVVAVNLIGTGNGVTHVTGTVAASGAVTLAVNDHADFPASGTLVVKIDSEEMVVTAGFGTNSWTVAAGNRGVNGTAAAAHSSGAQVTVATDVFFVNWTGTSSANGAGFTYLSGQGAASQPIPVTKRHLLTAADAGKTIIATVGGILAADTSAAVIFDSWQIEAPQPPPVVLTNLASWEYGNNITGLYAGSGGPIQAWNTMLAQVVAEFPAGGSSAPWVQIADVYTPWHARNGTATGPAGAAFNATDATTVATWTCNSTTFTPTVGMRFSFGFTGAEHCDVTAVSGAAPTWTLTLTRGVAGTSKQTHLAGAFLGPLQWMHTDDIHLTSQGHGVFAEIIYQALQAMPTPAPYQAAQMQGHWSQYTQPLAPGIVDGNWYTPPVRIAYTSASVAQNHQTAFPIYVPKPCIVTGMNVIPTNSSSGTIRYGIYMPDQTRARPGRLLCDFGALTYVTTLNWSITGLYQILRPGWYWMSVAVQATAVAMRCFDASSLLWPPLGSTAVPAGTANTLNGYWAPSISGPFADWALGTYNESAGAASVNSILIIGYQLRSINLS